MLHGTPDFKRTVSAIETDSFLSFSIFATSEAITFN